MKNPIQEHFHLPLDHLSLILYPYDMDAHLMVRGFVQGVGYRKWARKIAQGKGLTGWVRNLPDGSVEVLLQGEKETIETVIEEYKKGPFLSEVENVDVVWEEQTENFPDFSIRHDF